MNRSFFANRLDDSIGKAINFSYPHHPGVWFTAKLVDVGPDWIEILNKGEVKSVILPFTSIGSVQGPEQKS